MIDFRELHDILTGDNRRDFGFDSDMFRFLQNDISVCLDFAALYVRQSAELRGGVVPLTESYREAAITALGAAATLYRRAGAHALLIWESSAQQRSNVNPFLYAARCHYELNSGYAELLKSLMTLEEQYQIIVSTDISTRDWRESRQPLRAVDDNDPIQELYNQIWSVGGEKYRVEAQTIRRLRTVLGTTGIGVLNIPASRYIDILEGLGGRRDLEEDFRYFIQTYDDAMRTGMNNPHLWNSLAHPFHAAEPDILMILALNKKAGLAALEVIQNSILDATWEILRRFLIAVEE